MGKQINVLVFPAGEINAVEIHDALATCVNINVFGVSSVDRHGPYVFKNYLPNLPLITDETFIEKLNALLTAHAIDVIFPTHDAVAVYLTQNQAAIHAKIVAGDAETAEVCRDKEETYRLFADCPFIPTVYEPTAAIELPVFIKPKVGAGSVGAEKVTTRDKLDQVDFDHYVVTEYLPGTEYTVDCLTDNHGELKVIAPRSRDRTLAGISVAGRTQPLTPEIREIAETINKRLHFRGLWFFQIKQDSKTTFKLLEVSTRGAGTMCLTRVRGANLPLLSVYVAMGLDVEVELNDISISMDRSLISRYSIDYDYDTVYLDFDDTVIVRGVVHPYSILFIYQCNTLDKKIILLTRHAEKIHETLEAYHIDHRLFAEIVQLTIDQPKADYIKPERALFIDNAYQERKRVHESFKMPVFDVDALEVLLDWRL